MARSFLLICSLLLLSVLASCRVDDTPPAVAETLSEVATFDTGKHPLFKIADLVRGEDNSLYIVDYQGYTIHKYDTEGRHLAQAHHPTSEKIFEGPVQSMAFYRNSVYVPESAKGKAHVFTPNLEYIRTIDFAEGLFPFFNMDTDGEEALYSSSLSHEPEQKLIHLDAQLRVIRSYDLQELIGHPLWDVFRSDIDEAGRIVVAYSFRGIVEIIDPATGTQHSFRLDFGRGKPTAPPKGDYHGRERMIETPRPQEVFTWDVAVDKEIIYLLGGEFTPNPRRDVYVVDYEGNPLRTLILPAPSKRIHIDQDYLYTTVDEETGVTKYRLMDTPDLQEEISRHQ